MSDVQDRLAQLSERLDDVELAGERIEILLKLAQSDHELDDGMLDILFRCLSTNAENSQWTLDETVIGLIESARHDAWLASFLRQLPYLLRVGDWANTHIFYFLFRSVREDADRTIRTFETLEPAQVSRLADSLSSGFFAYYERNREDLSECEPVVRRLRELR